MNWFYFGMNLKARPGDEMFGISFGRFYVGYYRPGHSPDVDGWAIGFLDENDVLIQN